MIIIFIFILIVFLISILFNNNTNLTFESSHQDAISFVKNNFGDDVQLITNKECTKNNKSTPCLKNTSDVYMNLCPYGMKFQDGKCIDDFSKTNSSCIETKNSGTKVEKVALYWGGVVGMAASDASGDTMTQYLKNVVEFCLTPSKLRKGKNRIDVLYFVIEHWQSNSFGFLDPKVDWMGKVALPMISKLSKGKLEVGVVAYMNPKDAIWNYDKSLPGGLHSKSNSYTCEPINPGPKGCPGIKGKKGVDYGVCSTTGDCNKGCPNYASQVMKYIGEINKKTKGVKITYFIMDGEDAGGYQSPNGFCFLDKAKNKYAPDIKHIGMAKGIAITTVKNNKYPNIFYPETYWYMNDLAPCHGSGFELENQSEVCTKYSSYIRFKDKPDEYLEFLKQASCADTDSLGLLKLSNNLKNNKDKIWPMFSIENLSLAGSANNCLAKEFHPANVAGKPQMCGTFDGFSHWSWDKFESFLIKFANEFDSPNVAVYEAQFLPPHWFKNNTYPYEYQKPKPIPGACQHKWDCKPCNECVEGKCQEIPGCHKPVPHTTHSHHKVIPNTTNIPPDNCPKEGRPNDCKCDHSWDCESNWCAGKPPTCQPHP